MNPELLAFPSSLVGGRPRPRGLFTDPFSSPVPSWGNVPEADSEAVLMAPLRQRRSCFFDDGPRSGIQEGDLANMPRKNVIHPSVGMRSPTEFKRAPDGGASEIAIYEAYLEPGFRGIIPSLIGEISSFFGLCPSLLTPLTWRTLMAIQVLGELHGFSVGVHEILYSYYFAPLVNKVGFYHLRSRDGTPLIEEPSRGIGCNYPFGDDWRNRYVFVKIQEPVGFPTSWRTVDVSRPVSFAGEAVAKLIMGVPRRFRWVTFLDSVFLFPTLPFLGNMVKLPVSAIYDEHQKAKTRKRRPLYTLPPRLERAASLVNGSSSNSSTGAEAVQNMMSRRDLLIQQVKASARWEHMKEWLEKRVEHWDPKEMYHRHLFLSEGADQQAGISSLVATPRSVVGSRFSEDPSF
ncbi:hypothetical protein F2Q70_00011917 [Brassica cretica]|uniref:Uncharacterized protein n=1 Tax=Brassica cretica TaxID=69181 RepID=A0A8S9M5P8_BRACR|nr:hypothetical protein F2Q70_00011917 [Brassica cretica]KAF3550911.1 hypothetical protein DY000_02007495 [Brassica cretica]